MSKPGTPSTQSAENTTAHSLPRRFYDRAAVRPAPNDAGGFAVELDGKSVRTPGKALLVVPSQALADALAAEWNAQGERIDPRTMPLTRLVNSIIDGVHGQEAEVRADIIKYAGSDLLCYRADGPAALVERQAKAWDDLLTWARSDLGVRLTLAQGIMPVGQQREAVEAVARIISAADPYRLAALHVMTTLTGSVLLALAVLRGRLSVDEAWARAHVDEDWQNEHWGEDAEAVQRRRHRWSEMQSAARLLDLLNQP